MKKIILIGLSAFGIASAQNAVPPSTFIPGQQAPGGPATQPGQPFPGGPAAQPGQPFPGGPATQPGQPFPGGPAAQPLTAQEHGHMEVHGVIESTSPQKVIVKNETGALNEFAVDDYSEVILPPINYLELDQEDHRELTGARVHIGVGIRPNGRKAIDHIHVHMEDDHGPEHDEHAGVPHASAPGGIPHTAAPGAPIHQTAPGGIPHTAAPGAPIHQTGHEADLPGEEIFGVIERADSGKIIIKTEAGTLAELSADDYSEIMFPPEKYLDLDREDHQRMIGQRVNLAIGSRPNGQNAVDHIDILPEDHDEPHHDGPDHAIDPATGNAPLPPR